MATAGASAAAAAAAARQQQILAEQQEEEEMSAYSSEDLAGNWEFKIVRSPTAQFRSPEAFRRLVEEEKRGGWTLVEKFDDVRVRFKRRANAKTEVAEFEDGYDPYRTSVPDPDLKRRLMILFATFGGILLALFLIFVMVIAVNQVR